MTAGKSRRALEAQAVDLFEGLGLISMLAKDDQIYRIACDLLDKHRDLYELSQKLKRGPDAESGPDE